MSIDVIRSIKQAETEADQIVKQSAAEARQIVAEAREQSYKLLKQSETVAEEEAGKILGEAGIKAGKEAEKIMEMVSRECEAIKEQARAKSQDAVGMILGRIVKTHGNC